MRASRVELRIPLLRSSSDAASSRSGQLWMAVQHLTWSLGTVSKTRSSRSPSSSSAIVMNPDPSLSKTPKTSASDVPVLSAFITMFFSFRYTISIARSRDSCFTRDGQQTEVKQALSLNLFDARVERACSRSPAGNGKSRGQDAVGYSGALVLVSSHLNLRSRSLLVFLRQPGPIKQVLFRTRQFLLSTQSSLVGRSVTVRGGGARLVDTAEEQHCGGNVYRASPSNLQPPSQGRSFPCCQVNAPNDLVSGWGWGTVLEVRVARLRGATLDPRRLLCDGVLLTCRESCVVSELFGFGTMP